MSELILPNPQKANDPKRARDMAITYLLELRKLYMIQCFTGEADNFNKFLKFCDNSFYKKQREIKTQNNKTVTFKKDDVYNVKNPEILKKDRLEALHYTAKYLYSLVSLFLSDSNLNKKQKEKLSEFIKWILQYIKKSNISTVNNVAKS